MFGPARSDGVGIAPPPECSFDHGDWHILVRFWHPVAFADDIGEDRPSGATLLDVPLVLFRTEGAVVVARNACPHRGAPLDRGRIVAGRLQCPMHGLEFGDAGRCLAIPSLGDRAVLIPPRLDLAIVRHEVRYGLVWVCLSGDPVWPLPDWEGLARAGDAIVSVPVETWRTSAGRHVENFNDVAHFPFVHRDSFGGEPGAGIASYQVREVADGLAFDLPYVEPGNRFPDGAPPGPRAVTYRYSLTFPFATLIEVQPEGSAFVLHVADVASPSTAHECRIFQIQTDFSTDPDRALWIADATMINNEDRPLVEAQRPVWLPLDPRDEGHIPADRFSIAYRRALVERFGLGRRDTMP